ncbi:hypothetical protein BAUCODRAFT_38709 [Baudoinia panamericana UAMH 10762]|uniref:RRM domain-containing protein n=1 Tax=Baudoinia panamericana (strain UAMH 10762) TaxID=717646 RepID=M2MZ57_BAUPA|nr:uncharacterized protein BAUCODRAFT_38709 [Baudoinia panamericana UAMH 10762]EMC91600.1 hypothetical protein BAUCODRAFT_38709 [Baudoinia panamericana UAMH 10762]
MSDDGDEIPPSATIYIKNLDEDVKLTTLVPALRELFEDFGNIIDIVAKKSVKRKGQAFIVYDSVDAAQDAKDEMNSFEIFGKPMHIEFAKTRSDATVLRENGEEALEEHMTARLEVKKRKQDEEAEKAKAAAKRVATETLAERPAKAAKVAQPAGIVPEEYLPPNKILYLRDLPEDYGKDALTAIYSRFPGFKEVRTVPTRKTIAFVEYDDESGAIAAKDATGGMTLGEQAIKVTFQRK